MSDGPGAYTIQSIGIRPTLYLSSPDSRLRVGVSLLETFNIVLVPGLSPASSRSVPSQVQLKAFAEHIKSVWMYKLGPNPDQTRPGPSRIESFRGNTKE
ncbi:hypothetical protein H0H93_016968 [Arthromyces matolae]|nr:hypothetical protein H0H93_016968 [Arthromyces matolae]